MVSDCRYIGGFNIFELDGITEENINNEQCGVFIPPVIQTNEISKYLLLTKETLEPKQRMSLKVSRAYYK